MQVSSAKAIRWARFVVGGRLGVLAWSLSGASAAAIVVWGLEAVALPLLMLKTASWGMWGVGVLRESRIRRRIKGGGTVRASRDS
ncbi:MAG: hypothetical protein PHE55_02865 [Methylococcaceae bacterium]|nr:hypothetical protein [Methylococcaceae bacterium]